MKHFTSDKKNYIVFSRGNKKLKETEKIRYFIFNLPAVRTCPQSTALCRKNCYALKAERMYKTASDARNNNLEVSRLPEFSYILASAIMKEARLAYKAGKQLVVRFHESGDIYSPEYAKALIEAHSMVLEVFPSVMFFGYTKSVKILDQVGYNRLKYPRFKIYFSVWSDTIYKDEMLSDILNMPIYKAVDPDQFKLLHEKNKCECVNCSTCGKCFNPFNHNTLSCEIH